ncbi:MAG: hypothetical protein V3T41_05915 [bacterium]
MDGERRMWRVATRAAVAVGGVAFFILLSCGEAVLPQPTRWVERARFSGDIRRVEDLAVDTNGSVYFATEVRDNRAAIYRYDGSALKEVFRSRYPDSTFGSVGCGGGQIWAAGIKNEGAEEYAYCVRSDDGVIWEEVEVPAYLGVWYLSSVYPAADGTVWFYGGTKQDDAVYTYRDGEWRRHEETAGAYALRLAVTARGRAFVYHYQHKVLKMLISDDGGATWTRETVSLANPQYNFKRPSRLKMATAGDTVYLLGQLNSKLEGFDLWSVIEREDVPPGQGRYYVAFASPHGEYFYKPSIMAFRSLHEGYVLGSQTSIRLEDGEWIKELIPASWNPQFDAVAAGPQSYWAIAGSSEIYRDPVLYEATFE